MFAYITIVPSLMSYPTQTYRSQSEEFDAAKSEIVLPIKFENCEADDVILPNV